MTAGTAEPTRPLEVEIERAKAGDRAALESVMRAARQQVYALALRFLWHPDDADDATQEILIRVLTHLGRFRGDSAFRTWVYRIACNHLVTLRRKRMEERTMSLEAFGEDLARGLSDTPLRVEPDAHQALLYEEVRIGCTQAMLLCLDRGHRLAYILGEILELDHKEAAEVLDITPAAYRKRLSRAREAITSFMTSHCGLVNPTNPCRCRRRVSIAVELGRVQPTQLLFASSAEGASRFPEVLAEIRRLTETQRAAALYRAHVPRDSSESFVAWLRTAVRVE